MQEFSVIYGEQPSAAKWNRIGSNFTVLDSRTTTGWVDPGHTLVYVSASSFKVVGVDVTSIYVAGTKLRFKQGGGWKYALVASSTYSTDTTVTIVVNTDYTIANAVITDNYYSYEATPTGLPSRFSVPNIIGWATLSSNGDTLTISALPARKHLTIILTLIATGGGTVNAGVQFNGDTAGNYAYRTSDNGGADSTGTSQTAAFLDAGTSPSAQITITHVFNWAAQEKVLTTVGGEWVGSGAGTAPNKREIINKWANTSSQITSLVCTNSGTGDYGAGTDIIVIGHD